MGTKLIELCVHIVLWIVNSTVEDSHSGPDYPMYMANQGPEQENGPFRLDSRSGVYSV